MDLQQNHTSSKTKPNNNQSPNIVSFPLSHQFEFAQGVGSDNPIPLSQPQEPLYRPQIQLTENVKFKLSTNNNNFAQPATLQIDDQRYCLVFNKQDNNGQLTMSQESAQVNPIQLYINFSNTQNLGTSGNSIVIFINQKGKNDNQTNQETENQPNQADQIIHLMKTQKKANLFLQGQCTLTIQFINKEVMQKAYQLLSLYIGQEDEGADDFEEDQELGEMICADNIDENGNIILNQGEQQSDNQEEDDLDQAMEDESQGHS